MRKKIASIDALKQQGTGSAAQTTTSADVLYLSTEQKKMAEKQAQCRLFFIRAKEAIGAYKTAIAQLSQQQTLARGVPLWNMINPLSEPSIPAVDWQTTAIQMPDALQSPLIWFAIVCSALALSILSLTQIRKNHFFRHYFHIKRVHITHVLALSACLITGMLSLYLLIFLKKLTLRTYS